MRLPDFLIIGAMKAGTTSLHNYLGLHPDIFSTPKKEIHYFDDNNYNGNLELYCKNFETYKKIAGASPQGYTKQHSQKYKNVPRRLSQHVPHVKLIYLLRDPIQRIYSHYYEQQSRGYAPKKSLSSQLKNFNESHFINTSRYYYQISHFLNYFPLDQIKIITLEDLRAERLKTLNEIFDFLGVQKMESCEPFGKQYNTSREKRRKLHIKSLLPHSIKTIYKRVLSEKYRGFLDSKFLNRLYIEKELKVENIDPVHLNEIKDYLSGDVDQLRTLTGLKLDNWEL